MGQAAWQKSFTISQSLCTTILQAKRKPLKSQGGTKPGGTMAAFNTYVVPKCIPGCGSSLRAHMEEDAMMTIKTLQTTDSDSYGCINGVCMFWADPGRFFYEGEPEFAVTRATAKAAGWDVKFWALRRRIVYTQWQNGYDPMDFQPMEDDRAKPVEAVTSDTFDHIEDGGSLSQIEGLPSRLTPHRVRRGG